MPNHLIMIKNCNNIGNAEIALSESTLRLFVSCITHKGNSLDLGLNRDDSVVDCDALHKLIESGKEAIAQLEGAVDLLQ